MRRLVPFTVFILAFWAVWVNLPTLDYPIWFKAYSGKYKVKLGLDLQGGTQLTLQAQTDKINSKDRDTALESSRGVIERRVNLYGVSEAVVRSSKIGGERRILVELPGIKDTQTAVDLVGSTAQLDFREMIGTPSAQSTGSAIFNLFKPTGLTGADLKRAQVTFGQGPTAGPQVSLEFTSDGARKFAEITKRNMGKPLAMFLDDQPISWPPPVVQTEILNGQAIITGKFSLETAKNLSIQLNAGALPVPIKILEQRSIGATLGDISIQKSIIAGVIGILTVMFYMMVYYGIYGLVANGALLIYSILILAVFRTGAYILPPITLTMAGIAGFILSVGMAVDANILIFERMKEEIRSDKSMRIALESGFLRAWPSIRDSNISSLITATILYILGTSVVRGFAVTLFIGVLVSMFSAIVVTRTFLRLLPRFRK